jgi:hypothetical protein
MSLLTTNTGLALLLQIRIDIKNQKPDLINNSEHTKNQFSHQEP